MARYPDIGDGWLRVPKRGFRLKCCSCSLVHVVDFRIVDGQIEIRMDRHERATSAARRSLRRGVVIVDD
jgi:hypothetical protein